jgi:hypothetical protein
LSQGSPLSGLKANHAAHSLEVMLSNSIHSNYVRSMAHSEISFNYILSGELDKSIQVCFKTSFCPIFLSRIYLIYDICFCFHHQHMRQSRDLLRYHSYEFTLHQQGTSCMSLAHCEMSHGNIDASRHLVQISR